MIIFKAGIGIKPGTSAEVLVPFVDLVDMVLIMTVEPGFGGQKFMGDMMPKVRPLSQLKYDYIELSLVRI